jgi:Ca2+-binding EF-hand superfamily protein
MDWINKINMIVEKMKMQMHAKGIDSLDKVFIQIAQFDTARNGLVDKLQFEPFLAMLGVFLKTQELTEIHKYLNTYENGGAVSFERFVELLKCEVPESLVAQVKNVFAGIKDDSGCVTYDNLMKAFNVEHHPQVKLMHKEVPLVQQEFDIAVKFVLGDKPAMSEEEFVELRRNMYWVTPRENITYFFKMIPGLWSA